MLQALAHPDLAELTRQPMVQAYIRLLNGEGLNSVAHILPPGMAAELSGRLNEGMTLVQALAHPSVIETVRSAAEEAAPCAAEIILDVLNQLGRCPHCGGHALLSRFGGVPDAELRSLEAEVAAATS